MDSPLALQVWVSESPIAYPCWSVVSSLPQTISAGRGRKARSRGGGAPGLVVAYFAVRVARG